MKSFSFLLFFALSLSAFSQSITGTWYCANTINTPGGYSSTLVLLADGYFHVQWDYQGGYTDPIYGWGAYSNSTEQLILQYFDGSRQEYVLEDFKSNSFVLFSPAENERWEFSYTGSPQLEEWKQIRLQSESVFYQLTGQWEGNGETLKFLGDGVLFVARENQTSVLYTYRVYGNRLEILDINAEAPFYVAEISDLGSDGFYLSNDNETAHYSFNGNVQLDSNETLLYTTYLNIIHRSSMTAIDLMDGVRDFIWKRVDKHGNVKE